MKKQHFSVLFLTIVVLLFAHQPAFSHCEIPCGIYGDEARFETIAEHITTVEKSMQMVVELSQEEPINYNQLVRWVNNKETHAQEIQQIVYQYFLTQRVKPVEESKPDEYKEYLKKLTLLHEMLVYAMKAKQTTDLEHVKKLKSLLTEFHEVYFDHEAGTHK